MESFPWSATCATTYKLAVFFEASNLYEIAWCRRIERESLCVLFETAQYEYFYPNFVHCANTKAIFFFFFANVRLINSHAY